MAVRTLIIKCFHNYLGVIIAGRHPALAFMSAANPDLSENKAYAWYTSSGPQAQSVALKLQNWLWGIFDVHYTDRKVVHAASDFPGCLSLVSLCPKEAREIFTSA